MIKFAIVLLAVVLLLWLLFGRARRARGDRPPPSSPRGAAPEGMVACAHCGVHLPGSEALRLGERVYCSAAHRDAGPRG
jgi:uncharacterized protein